MKSFRLQTVLDYRQRLEDEAFKAVIRCREERNRLSAHRDVEQTELVRLCQECAEAKQNRVHLPEVMLYEDCIVFKKQQLLLCEQKIQKQEAILKQRENELVQARQQRRMLEILKEKRLAAEQQRELHQERKILDEVAVLNFGGRQ